MYTQSDNNIFLKSNVGEVKILQVKGTHLEETWNEYINRWHYLGNKRLSGHSLKYLIYIDEEAIAALSWKSGSLKLRVRDQFIGWSMSQKKEHNKRIINNSRFLIIPNKAQKNVGSFVMSKMLKCLKKDWQKHFGYEPWLLETFVDSRYFDGALYKASNWKYLGQTSGYGKGTYYNHHGNIKEVYIYEIISNYREKIGCTAKNYDPIYRPPKWMFLLEDFKMILFAENWKPGVNPDIEVTEEYINNLSSELEIFHGLFSSCYTRKEQEINGMVYFTGLFSDIPRKSIEPIALNYSPNMNVRGIQKFMKDSVWDDKKMQNIHQTELLSIIGDENGMITLDPSDVAKKGKESVGVSRQYCGSTGKTDNCQCGIHMGYTSEKGYGLIASQLYMPKSWFEEDYKERLQKTLVPSDLKFKTKNIIGSELINKAISEGVKAQWIGVDSAFGSDLKFLNSLPKNKWYFAGIKSNERIFTTQDNQLSPLSLGEDDVQQAKADICKPLTVSKLAACDNIIWQDVVLGEGAKGPVICKMSFHRIYLSRKNKPVGEEQWLIMRKHSDGQIRYAISNAPQDLPLLELIKASTMRWPIEQCFHDGKGHLGMDHYEHRSWPAWHRHMTFVALGLHLLLKLRLKSPSKKKHHI